MANIPTVQRFGVPISGVNQGILHPKQKYRFRVLWYNFGVNFGLQTMTASVMTCTRPKLSHTEAELHAYNSVAWVMGKHSWSELEIKIRDDITNSVTTSVGSQIQKQINHYQQTSAVAGVNYKFQMEIHSMDGTTNEELESWYLEGVWIKDITYAEGDYSTGDVQEITLSLRYDNACNIAGPNTNLGTSVGGDPFPDNDSPRGGGTFA